MKVNREEIWGNVLLKSEESGLPKDSVINVSQIATIDKNWLESKTDRGAYYADCRKEIKNS